jgi:hypothetical protein
MDDFLFILLQSWNDIDKAAGEVRSSVDNLCYVLCALFGLVGSIRIYNKWQLNNCRHLNLDAEIAGWFGASVFFFIATTLINQVF